MMAFKVVQEFLWGKNRVKNLVAHTHSGEDKINRTSAKIGQILHD
jgi:hypothetical protein